MDTAGLKIAVIRHLTLFNSIEDDRIALGGRNSVDICDLVPALPDEVEGEQAQFAQRGVAGSASHAPVAVRSLVIAARLPSLGSDNRQSARPATTTGSPAAAAAARGR